MMRKFDLNLDLTGVIVIIAVGVLVPVMLSTAAGIVAIVFAEGAGGIVIGVLVISFAATATGSALITVVLTSRKVTLARRQADFVANVSHELRTPLSAIKLYAQTLQSGKLLADPEQAAQCLEVIVRETEWLDVMIDRVLTWRASSKDMMALTLKDQPVSRALDDAVSRFRAMVRSDEMTFTTSLHGDHPVGHDSRALTSVVLNLLVNAYKYTRGDKRISLTSRDENGSVVIEVADNGIGLAPAEAKRVFQPFYRVEKPQGAQTSGVGLGLAIARYLVERHGGSLCVHSEEGHGSVFAIRLPATERNE